jgi:hypothetical protein
MHRFASLYATLAKRVTAAQEAGDKLPGWWETFASVPGKVLSCYLLGFEEDKVRVDAALGTLIGGPADDEEPATTAASRKATTPTKRKTPAKAAKATDAANDARASALLQIVRGLDEKAQSALSQLLAEKRAFQRDFQRFIELRGEDPTSKPVLEALDKLAVRVPALSTERGKEFMRRLNEKREASVLAHLEVLADPASPPANATGSFLTLLRASEDSSSKKSDKIFAEYVAHVAQRLHSSWIANDRVVAKILGHLAAKRSGVTAIFTFLLGLATCYPDLVKPALEDVIGLLDVKHLQGAREDVVRVLTSDCADGLERTDSHLARKAKKRLLALCDDGTPKQASLAIRAISRMAANPAADLTALLRKIVADKLELDNEHLPTALQAVGRIAEALKDGAAFEDTAPSAVPFVMGTLLKQPPSSDLTQAKKHGIKFLARYLASLKEYHDAKASPIIDILFGIIGKKLAASDEDDEPDTRCAAARAVVSLARYKPYEQLITPDHLQMLASVARDKDQDVRAGFERKLGKGLASMQLPLRYLAVLAYFADEPKKELLTVARIHMQQCVQRRREYAKRINSPALQSQQQKLFHFVPEYALSFLVSLLAHNDDFEAN